MHQDIKNMNAATEPQASQIKELNNTIEIQAKKIVKTNR